MKRFRIPRRQRMFAVLPTMLTLGNAVCGFGAITFAAKVDLATRTGWGKTDSECLFIAAVLVFLAMVFDMLDGRAARWAKQTSEFGAQLDSLCDAISFGAAPAMILIKFSEFSNDFHPRILWGIAVLFVLCAILRLARFNVETDEEDTHEFFSGLPSPAAAGTVVSFLI
ncbi:MAG TPA: CDP-diacylglycerol--serine O-phosphatidyltransferase, partial [Planctomycetaceae bacterium]|nr:CDP-diacylglycerol--serine O-phosphatidyltransferase [Planctomycetaceae bacterium]